MGKTKILDALRRLCRVATESGADPGEVEWVIAFEHEGQEYRWEGATARPEGPGGLQGLVSGPAPLEISREKIVAGETVLIERKGDVFRFGEDSLPKLPKSDSAILLLRDEDRMRPLFRAFSCVVFSRAATLKPNRAESTQVQEISTAISGLQEGGWTFENFRGRMASVNGRGFLDEPLLIADIMYRAFPAEFDKVKALFIDIFSSVRELSVIWIDTSKTEGYSYLEFTKLYGELSLKNMKQGFILATGVFTEDAVQQARNASAQDVEIVLIEGPTITDFLEDLRPVGDLLVDLHRRQILRAR